MVAKIIDGTSIAKEMRRSIAAEIASTDLVPGLAVILVGDDPASGVYVAAKARQTREVGMRSIEHRLTDDIAEDELLALIARLNRDDTVDGILVQLPLPAQVDQARILRAIDPGKDVDGFHPMNAGLVATGTGGIVPCTPRGVMLLLESFVPDMAGLDALVVGCSNIVGKPMAQLLLRAGCTVTMAHSKTLGLDAIVRRSDIVVVAVGRPGLIRGDWIKPGAAIVDVGINRVSGSDGKSRLVGDVAFAEAVKVAGAITPVPGGVGPMTIACLLRNTLDAAKARRAIVPPPTRHSGESRNLTS
jgi:methylenetetrahydrofolate dehydrogenase (NADP+)/methenyltetrahydrofolate cyclohydrolase